MKLKNKIIILVLLALVFLALMLSVLHHSHFLATFDEKAALFADMIRTNTLDQLMLSITTLCNTYQAIFLFIIFGLFLIAKRKKHSFYIFAIATSLGLSLIEIIKVVVGRIRPTSTLLTETGFSFPSGHATLSTIYLLSIIFLIAPLIKSKFSRILFICISSVIFPLVAASRIYLSVHFASDVLAGILFGSFCYLFADIVTRHSPHTSS